MILDKARVLHVEHIDYLKLFTSPGMLAELVKPNQPDCLRMMNDS